MSLNIRIFLGNDTYIPITGMTHCWVRILAGGGGGGGCTSIVNQSSVGGSGGSGGYQEQFFTAAQIGSSRDVTVGTGGAGGTAGNNAGSAGGNSLFYILNTQGGSGGQGSPTQGAPTVITAIGPQNTISGDLSVPGGNGDNGFVLSTALVSSGKGADSLLGMGGKAQGNGNGATNGWSATGYGSGGSGGTTVGSCSASGGNGAPGIVIIHEYY